MFFFIFWYRPAKEKVEKRNEKAVQISKYFGDSNITLFRFSDSGEHRPVRVWALVDFNSRLNDPRALCLHEKRFIVGDTFLDTPKAIQKEEDEVRALIQLLPYRIEIWDTDIPFSEYESRTAKRKESLLKQEEHLRQAKYGIKENIRKAQTILKNFDQYDPFEATQNIYFLLDDIDLAITNLENDIGTAVIE